MKKSQSDKKQNKKSYAPATGCMGMILDIGVWVVSTIFMTIGGALFIFGVFTFEAEITAGTIFALIAVPVAIIIFIRTGRAILRDLRNPK